MKQSLFKKHLELNSLNAQLEYKTSNFLTPNLLQQDLSLKVLNKGLHMLGTAITRPHVNRQEPIDFWLSLVDVSYFV